MGQSVGSGRSVRSVLLQLSQLLLAVYLVVVITQMLPLALADPAWWLRWIAVASANGVILVLAGLLGGLARRHGRVSRLKQRRFASLAALGVALLIPLQLGAAVLQDRQVSRAEQGRVALLQRRFDRVTDAAAGASSREALQELAATLTGDATQPLQLPLPFDAARRQVVEQVALGRRQAMATMERAIAARRLRALIDGVRVVLLALLLAMALWGLR